MTLREFLDIFFTRRKLLLALIAAAILFGIIFYRLQIQAYNVSVLISLVRTGTVATTEYEYDHFYRLQADERFADTLVRYLLTEEGERSVIARADLVPGERAFVLSQKVSVHRLSSQLISVTLKARSLRGGEELARALEVALNQYILGLNTEAKEPRWFAVQMSEPIITDARISWRVAVGAGFLSGCFVAFWVALLQHALSPRPLGVSERERVERLSSSR